MTTKTKSRAGVAVAVFFLALTLIGLFTSGDYGLPCDEPAEQIILRENMKEYAWLVLGPESDAVRYYDSLGVQRISESIERDHGQCAYYPAAPLLLLDASAPDTMTTLWHAYTWLWFMLGVWAIYGFCRETGLSRPVSCAGALLLYLCPRFFAEGHYNNKDMVLLSLVLCTLWLGARLLARPGFLRGLLFSLAGAMAANTKIAGAFAWGVMGLCAVVMLTARRGWSLRTAGVALTTILSFLGFYALLTPALWSGPVEYLRYLLQNASGFTRWPGVVVFRGMTFEHSIHPLPRYYLPYMMLVTLPLYVPPLAIVGQLSAIRRAARQKKAALTDPATLSLLAATLAWLPPLAFAVATRPLVYNGWRHFYFVYAGVALLGAHGIGAAWAFCKNRSGAWRKALSAAMCACFLFSAMGISQNHPYQYGYYNILARTNAESDLELDYWDVSTVNAMQRLLFAERDETLPLTLGARDDMSWFGVEHGYAVLNAQSRGRLTVAYEADAPYLFLNTTYARIYGVAPPEGYRELFTVESYGNTLCAVYEADRPQDEAPLQAQ